jgi:hypothetical protein
MNDKNLRGQEARQGERGKPVVYVLVIGLLLALLAWGASEFFAESTDPDAGPATVETVAPEEPATDAPEGAPATEEAQ